MQLRAFRVAASLVLGLVAMLLIGEGLSSPTQASPNHSAPASDMPSSAGGSATTPRASLVSTAGPDSYWERRSPVSSPPARVTPEMAYDSARLPDPPTSIDELMVWIKNNPGKFTYAAMPDFTGSVFVRHLLYHVAGGHEDLLGPFDQAKFDAVSGKLWDLLNEIKPYLWRQGRTYPETQTQLRTLFANGEVWFDMSYNPVDAALKINEGMYPPTVRTFVFESGTIANTHYVAIPFNASAKAGAMVLANLMLDPEAQYEKARPEVWGDAPAMNLTKLHPRWQRAFAELPRHEAMLSPEELNRKQLPELQADWLAAVEDGWRTHVLGR